MRNYDSWLADQGEVREIEHTRACREPFCIDGLTGGLMESEPCECPCHMSDEDLANEAAQQQIDAARGK